jgi:hypothetical protein
VPQHDIGERPVVLQVFPFGQRIAAGSRPLADDLAVGGRIHRDEGEPGIEIEAALQIGEPVVRNEPGGVHLLLAGLAGSEQIGGDRRRGDLGRRWLVAGVGIGDLIAVSDRRIDRVVWSRRLCQRRCVQQTDHSQHAADAGGQQTKIAHVSLHSTGRNYLPLCKRLYARQAPLRQQQPLFGIAAFGIASRVSTGPKALNETGHPQPLIVKLENIGSPTGYLESALHS